MPSQFDKEKTRKKINLMLEKVKTEVDPHLLNEYRSLFKKEVSFFRRSWMAAYLLMLSDQGQGNTGRYDRNRPAGNFNRGSPPDGGARGIDGGARGIDGGARGIDGGGNSRSEGFRPESPRTEPRSETPRQPLPEEESRRLFISIGRNRRVFPREILGLINARTEISRDDIGAIRILDNYSFVQVRSSAADTIIEALNGRPFRGRVLSVNYARPRKEDPEEDRDEDSLGNGEVDSEFNDNAADSPEDVLRDSPADTGEYGEDKIEDEAENEAAGSPGQEDDQRDEEGV